MRSCSESGFTSKVVNAEKLLTLLEQTSLSSEFNPTINEFKTTIAAIKQQNAVIILKKQHYSQTVEDLKQLFILKENAIRKRLSLIGAYVKTHFGKTSEEAIQVTDFISGIRGANRVHNVGNSSVKNNINQSYLSYTSQIRLFSELIIYLKSLDNTYKPSNKNLTVAALQSIQEKATYANDAVIVTYTELLQIKNNRKEACIRLNQLAQEIKTCIKKTDYNQLPEFRHLRNLKI